MKYPRGILCGVLLVSVLPLVAQTNRPKPKDQHVQPSNTTASGQTDRGQQVFEQNCSRCHNAPQGFPANVTGTIAMHMRVRANLSEADYKALKRFLNP